MITHIIVWIEIEHIIHLLLFGYPIIIILIKFEERAVELWNICLVQKQRKNGAFERRVQILCKQNRIPGVSKIGYMWLIPKAAEKPTDGRRKGNKK
jgi:hypothetical protein